MNDISFLTCYGISCHLLQALWLIANLLPSLQRLPGYHLYKLINKLSWLHLTAEVATAPELRAAIHSTDICPESAAPCSKAATHWHRWATGALRIMLNPSCKALLLAPFPRSWLAAVTAAPLTLAVFCYAPAPWCPGSLLPFTESRSHSDLYSCVTLLPSSQSSMALCL